MKIKSQDVIKYFIAVTKSLILSILVGVVIAVCVLIYTMLRFDSVAHGLSIINGPIFFYNFIIIFGIISTYFIYRASLEFY